MRSLVNSFNDLFVSVSEQLPILQASHPIFEISDPMPELAEQYTISGTLPNKKIKAVLANLNNLFNKQTHWVESNSAVDIKDFAHTVGWICYITIHFIVFLVQEQ